MTSMLIGNKIWPDQTTISSTRRSTRHVFKVVVNAEEFPERRQLFSTVLRARGWEGGCTSSSHSPPLVRKHGINMRGTFPAVLVKLKFNNSLEPEYIVWSQLVISWILCPVASCTERTAWWFYPRTHSVWYWAVQPPEPFLGKDSSHVQLIQCCLIDRHMCLFVLNSG